LIRASAISDTSPASGRAACLLMGLSLCLFSLTSACEKKADQVHTTDTGEFTFHRLLVLPFERAEGMVCPLCQKSALSCRIEPEAESSLNKLVMAELRKMPGIELVSQAEVNQEVLEIPEPERTRLQLAPDFAILVAREVRADAVMRNLVFCYQERVGSAVAASRPAAISFHVHLFRADSGKMVWMGKYEEEQVSLSENLLTAAEFFRRGARWVKVEELAQDGMLKAMADFPRPGGAAP
jgi:hypothetical protein